MTIYDAWGSERIANFRSWTIADWLINYEGGFVRRGLMGELILMASRILHIDPIHLVVGFYLILSLLMVLLLRAVLAKGPTNFWVLFLIFSPATLSFPLLSLIGGFRKELIFLCSFLIFLLLLRSRVLSKIQISCGLFCLAIFLVLCHEALLFYLPYFVIALYVSGYSLRDICWMATPGALGACVTAWVVANHPGNPTAVAGICTSLGYREADAICGGGAIAYLKTSRAMARQEIARFISAGHYLTLYIPAIVLSFLPLGMALNSLRRSEARSKVPGLQIGAVVAILASLPLFLYTADWGRWIYIHVMSLGALVLLANSFSVGRVADLETASTGRLRLNYALLVVYALAWALPPFAHATSRFGAVGLMYHAIAHPGLP